MTLSDSAPKQQTLFRLILAAALVMATAAILVPAGHGWDFANFYDTGRRAAHGQLLDIYNPDTPIAGSAPQGKMAFWGAPISALFYAPLALFPPGIALIVLKLAGTLAYAAALVLLYREFKPPAKSPAETSWFLVVFAGLVLLYQPFWTIYRVGGQTTPVVFLLLVLGLMAYVRERMVLAALCMVLAVLVKPAFVFVPAFLALFSGRRYLVSLVALAGVAGLLSLALFGLDLHLQFLDLLRRGSRKPSPWPFNSSLYIIADAFRPITDSIPVPRAGGWFPDALRLAIKVVVVGTVGRLLWRSRAEAWAPAARRLFIYLAAIAFCLLISQVVWEHYLAVLFIPLAFLLSGSSRLSGAARLHLMTIFVLAGLQNLVLVLLFRDLVPVTSTAALLAVSIVKAGPLLAFLLFLWFHESAFFGLVARRPGQTAVSIPAPVIAGAPA